MDKFGVADETKLYSMLPAALAKFQARHVWDFLIPPVTTFATVANQDWVNVPANLFKVLGIWKTNYEILRMSRKQWTRFKAFGTLTETRGQYYAHFGRRIYLSPVPNSAETYNILYYASLPNLALSQVPHAYHYYIQKILETMGVPKAVLPDLPNPYPAFKAEEELAFKQALEVEFEQPDDSLKIELSNTNRTINMQKRGMRRGKNRLFAPGFAVNR